MRRNLPFFPLQDNVRSAGSDFFPQPSYPPFLPTILFFQLVTGVPMRFVFLEPGGLHRIYWE
ncbi:MAG: hypothetical protein Q4B25_02700 [Pseudomonadota bacterium]|nr:hypothetical protein [Pseudomonadota bacterium]